MPASGVLQRMHWTASTSRGALFALQGMKNVIPGCSAGIPCADSDMDWFIWMMVQLKWCLASAPFLPSSVENAPCSSGPSPLIPKLLKQSSSGMSPPWQALPPTKPEHGAAWLLHPHPNRAGIFSYLPLNALHVFNHQPCLSIPSNYSIPRRTEWTFQELPAPSLQFIRQPFGEPFLHGS